MGNRKAVNNEEKQYRIVSYQSIRHEKYELRKTNGLIYNKTIVSSTLSRQALRKLFF